MGAFTELATEIFQGQAAGALRQEEPLGLALACWSIAHGLAGILIERLLDRRELAPAGTMDSETLTRMVTRLLVVGLARP